MQAHLTLARTNDDGTGSGLDIASKPEIDRDVVVVQNRHHAPLATVKPRPRETQTAAPNSLKHLQTVGHLKQKTSDPFPGCRRNEGEHWATGITRHYDPRTLGKVRGFSDIVAAFPIIRESILRESSTNANQECRNLFP